MRTRMEAEREQSWRLIEEIGRRDAHMAPDEGERDIADAISEMRQEVRHAGRNDAGSRRQDTDRQRGSAG